MDITYYKNMISNKIVLNMCKQIDKQFKSCVIYFHIENTHEPEDEYDDGGYCDDLFQYKNGKINREYPSDPLKEHIQIEMNGETITRVIVHTNIFTDVKIVSKMLNITEDQAIEIINKFKENSEYKLEYHIDNNSFSFLTKDDLNKPVKWLTINMGSF